MALDKREVRCYNIDMSKSKSPDPSEVIISSIEVLDDEMNSHKDNCLRCINGSKCKAWDDLVESFNFYSLGLRRYMKNSQLGLEE
jgi:hypothetical protein